MYPWEWAVKIWPWPTAFTAMRWIEGEEKNLRYAAYSFVFENNI
jgi:hypothetical protein